MVQLKLTRDQLLRNKRKNEEHLDKQDQLVRHYLSLNQRHLAKFAIQRSKLY